MHVVVVFWNDFKAGVVEGYDVAFVHGDRLVSWLSEQRQTVVDPNQVAETAACIKKLRPPEHAFRWSR